MVVVFANELNVIDQAHGSFEARVKARAQDGCFIIRLDSLDKLLSRGTEISEQRLERCGVVIGLVCARVVQIGGAQSFGASIEIIQAAQPERFQIKQMPNVFLNRPFIVLAPRQYVSRESTHTLFNPRRSAAQTLDQIRKHPCGQIKVEFALEPDVNRNHVS